MAAILTPDIAKVSFLLIVNHSNSDLGTDGHTDIVFEILILKECIPLETKQEFP